MSDDDPFADLGFPEVPDPLPINPYDEDGYCEFCGNGHWKHHAPWCKWQDAVEEAAEDAANETTAATPPLLRPRFPYLRSMFPTLFRGGRR